MQRKRSRDRTAHSAQVLQRRHRGTSPPKPVVVRPTPLVLVPPLPSRPSRSSPSPFAAPRPDEPVAQRLRVLVVPELVPVVIEHQREGVPLELQEALQVELGEVLHLARREERDELGKPRAPVLRLKLQVQVRKEPLRLEVLGGLQAPGLLPPEQEHLLPVQKLSFDVADLGLHALPRLDAPPAAPPPPPPAPLQLQPLQRLHLHGALLALPPLQSRKSRRCSEKVNAGSSESSDLSEKVAYASSNMATGRRSDARMGRTRSEKNYTRFSSSLVRKSRPSRACRCRVRTSNDGFSSSENGGRSASCFQTYTAYRTSCKPLPQLLPLVAYHHQQQQDRRQRVDPFTLGLVNFRDPPRQHAKDAAAELQDGLDFVHNLISLNVPAADIAGVMERMREEGEDGEANQRMGLGMERGVLGRGDVKSAPEHEALPDYEPPRQ
ncbi:hypothetical protein FIBSPDRAFT_1048714 [Athelia psychrophila]|uniref:Uncharacterized protein n=1 Tax=Athelia psychrophila TaxID=1759441 RepID=A0A166DED0_9AGAM|nr:hypothetical protein FIBSPDRAFT_1048714 [Fibularhizoctonia sp. CBS 109695]